MAIYYVNNKPHQNGVHEVHISTCSSLLKEQGKYLGYFDRAAEAVFAARHHFNLVNGCADCSASAHYSEA